MEERFEILHKFTDVHIWLLSLAHSENPLFGEATEQATIATTQHFNIPYSQINELITGTKFRYTKDEIPIVEFYFEHIRKIRDSHQ